MESSATVLVTKQSNQGQQSRPVSHHIDKPQPCNAEAAGEHCASHFLNKLKVHG